MKVVGIIFDHTNLSEVRNNGFVNFREIDGEIHYNDWELFEQWESQQQSKLDNFTDQYMYGSDDGKTFIFSDKPNVQQFIQTLYPASKYVVVDSENYPLDYDYIRDNAQRPWV